MLTVVVNLAEPARPYMSVARTKNVADPVRKSLVVAGAQAASVHLLYGTVPEPRYSSDATSSEPLPSRS